MSVFKVWDGSQWVSVGGGGAPTIEEVDGSPTESAPTKLKFPNGTLSVTSHEVTYTPTTVAPVDATYITQTANGTLTNEQALGALATGILKSTTTTGVLSIATGADLPVMVASGASHSAGAAPDPGASSGTTKFLREDATWVVPSGTGAPTDSKYVTTASDATLSAEVAIPGLAGSADIAGAGGGGITEEYDTSSTGLTWGSAPAVEDSNTTVLSHLYLKLTGANSEDLGTRSWTPGSGAFDARVKLALGSEATSNFQSFGLHIGASGNTSRLLCDILMDFTNRKWDARAFTYASGSYTQRGNNWSQASHSEIYLRIRRDGSNNIYFYFSPNGKVWQMIATTSFTLTVANIGYRISADNASTNYEYISDWLRTSV